MLVGWQGYEAGAVRDSGEDLEGAIRARGEGDFVWIRLRTPEEAELRRLADAFGLPELAVEDATSAHQRPKLERYGETTFVVVKPASYDDDAERIALDELHVFTGPGIAITIRHARTAPLDGVCRRLATAPELTALGPAAVLYGVVDEVVDAYDPVVRALEQDIDEIEQEVFDDDRQPPTERIYGLIREVLDFQRATESLLQPLEELAAGAVPGVDGDLAHFFRDVADHARLVHERTSAFRVLLGGALDANVALISLQENRDQRRISAWAAIALVPTILGGVWGMNVPLPLQDSVLGFPAVVVLMVASSSWLYWRLRRNGWL